MPRTRLLWSLVDAGILVAVASAVVLWHRPSEIQRHDIKSLDPAAPLYAGTERCAGCHVQEAEAWRHSHHAQAMQRANASTVLGNFNDARFAKDKVASSFYRKADTYYVRTDGPDGKLANYPITYTFGVYPLQQYLVPFP